MSLRWRSWLRPFPTRLRLPPHHAERDEHSVLRLLAIRLLEITAANSLWWYLLNFGVVWLRFGDLKERGSR
jgi:hypothetical protein